jgi:hypothetical protein
VIRRIPVFFIFYLVSLATGLTQLLFASFGHILGDSTWTRPIDQVQVPWFGYLVTSFWWGALRYQRSGHGGLFGSGVIGNFLTL